MKKLIQTRLVTTHKSGNCSQTAIACILDLPIDEVPDFSTFYWKEKELVNLKKVYEPKENSSSWIQNKYDFIVNIWDLAYEAFITSQGYRIVRLYDGKDVLPEYSYRDWLKSNPDKFYLASGDSLRGVSHVVIYQNDKLYHDPHPSQTGLVEGTIYEYKYFEKL